MNIRNLVFWILGLVLAGQGFTQSVYESQPVTVTASRLFSSLNAETRMVYVIDEEDIKTIPAESVQDVLRYANGVNLSARGDHVQADFNLRGSSFEQVLVLLDGVRLNDPQTGHHNSDIPVSVQDIERIEILTGHGSSLYGPDSFGGVIHIITKQAHSAHTHIGLSGGSDRSFDGMLSQSVVLGSFLNRVSIEKQKSDGYRWDTDYDNTVVSWRFHLRSAKKEISGTFGCLEKNFGANGFYGPAPSREKTSTLHGNVGFLYSFRPSLVMQSKLSYRYHRDRFDLDCLNPTGYKNDTRTWSGTIENQFNLRFSDRKECGFGVEVVREEANSTKWGSQTLYRGGAWFEMLGSVFNRMVVQGGIRLDRHETWGIQTSPSLGVSFTIKPHVRLRASAGRVFRAPTFTELFYRDDYNRGNVLLKPEGGWSAEVGLLYEKNQNQTEVTLFLRDEKDRIQWIRKTPEIVWRAENVTSARCAGITITQRLTLGKLFKVTGYYTYIHLNQTLPPGYASKYSLQNPRHHVKLSAALFWPDKISQTVFFNIKEYENEPTTAVLDAKWSRSFGKWSLYLDVTNIFGADYEEIIGVPMPGRQIMLGMELVL